MSGDIQMRIGNKPTDGFTVKSMLGCRIIFGSIPVANFAMIGSGFSKSAVFAPDIADRIGATLIIGEPKDIEALRKAGLPVSEQRHADYLAATQLGLHKVATWLRTGERGASSNAMCKHIFGAPMGAGDAYPRDPDDLRRCVLFLDATDAHDKVSAMAGVSRQWAGLVGCWPDLLAIFKEEMAAGKSAPKTYALMREILNG